MNKIKYPYKKLIQSIIKKETVLRGAMVLLFAEEELSDERVYEKIKSELTVLKKYGANSVRLGLSHMSPMGNVNLESNSETDLISTKDQQYIKLLKEKWLPVFKELNLAVILGFPDPDIELNDWKEPDGKFWRDIDEQNKFIKYSIALAKEFQEPEDSIIIGFDIMNEPVPPGCRCCPWKWSEKLANEDAPGGRNVLCRMYNSIIKGIREFDKNRMLTFSPGPWGEPAAFEPMLDIIDDPLILWQFHIYAPHNFTHNSVNAWGQCDKSLIGSENRIYPNGILNKDYIIDHIEPAVKFIEKREKLTGRAVPMWVGEFGLVSWLDEESQQRWCNDVLLLMEEKKWGWAWFIYTTGLVKKWFHFSQYGLEGDNADIAGMFDAMSSNNTDWYKTKMKSIRSSWNIVAKFMKSGEQFSNRCH